MRSKFVDVGEVRGKLTDLQGRLEALGRFL